MSINTHAIIAHNGKIHRTPTRTKTQSPQQTQTTAVAAPGPTAAEINLPPGPPQFLGESLLILIIVAPLILWQMRHQGLKG